ncbi:LysR family transcriptional regulator [Alkalimonas amylolytica]|uniref:DNA-binding transcriptional regulator, LysR family n=1 Tax=Alkalimonas amylolytica TaxID=152573 RepID=A0A1H4CIA9_ALKAM|nr:LysR family transcriptional regulator [Alkalimonas amylolytica]SEA60155.1 DNA-binding transcriptional regulator, LysR family [Alkalimonas amylolytica]
MQLSFEQLQAFLTTVETGSFSAAARKLGKAQSSISGLISNLEIDVGFEVFDRSKRTPPLTAEGLALLNDIKSVLKSYNNLLHRIQNLNQDVETEIALAFDDMALPVEMILAVASEFKEQFPNTALMLLKASHHQGYQLIQNGEVDLAIAISQDDYPEECAFRGISHVHYGTVVSSNHPLAQLASVTPYDLSQYRHLRITDPASGFRRFDSDLSTNIWFTNSSTLLIQAVQQGFGWAELPLNLIKPQLRSGELIKLPTSHQAVSFPHCVDMIWKSEGPVGQGLQWLLDRLTEHGIAFSKQ